MYFKQKKGCLKNETAFFKLRRLDSNERPPAGGYEQNELILA